MWTFNATTLIFVVGLSVALPTQARIYRAVLTGVVGSGVDLAQYYGTANGVLTGYEFAAIFRYDTATGFRTRVPGYYDHLAGGMLYAAPTPVIESSLKINGITMDVPASYWGIVYATPNDIIFNADNQFYDGANANFTIFGFNANTVSSPPSIDHEMLVTGTNMYGQIRRYDYSNVMHRYVQYVDASLVVDRLEVRAVPEPASWALIIAGFGMVGAALRHRRLPAPAA